MSKAARASAGLCVVIAVIACASVEDRAEPIGDRGDAIINGTAITDPVQVEVSKNVHLRTIQGGAQCSQGSGTLLTNEWVLTAWHVVSNACGGACAAVQPNEVDVTLGDITLGHQSRKADRFVFHPRVGAHNCFGNPDTDIALVHLASPFNLAGSTTGHFRPISDLDTPNLFLKPTTCFGYGRSALCGSAGPPLRFADFVVRPYPAPFPYTTQPPASVGFTVMKGGGVTHDDLGTGVMPYSGDSGGPCIDPNDPIKGKEDVLGVIQSVDGDRGFTCPSGASELDPRFTRIVAASAFRDFARAVLASAMPPVQMDINFDGHLDTFFIKELAGHLFVEVQLGGPGGVVFTLPPTGIPKILPAGSDRAMIQHGDFDKDGIQDLFAYINGVPLYLPGVIGFNPATPVPTNLSLVSSYQYVAPRDVNKDGTDDLVAVQSDGTEHIYLGQAGKGLTSAAHLFPRGFRFFEPDDEESFAISAPSFSKKLSFSTPGSIKATKGLVYLVSKDADGTLYKDELDLNLDGEAGLPTPEAADAYGFAMAWGNFSKSASGLAELVTGAPGRAVGTVKNAGVVQWMRYNPAKSTAPFVDSKSVDRATFGEKPSQWGYFGGALSAGDFDGDGADDLAIGRTGGVHVMTGGGTGAFPLTAKQTLTASTFGVSGSAFPSSLTSGDFNCDGFEDLAIGMGGAEVQGIEAGAVIVAYGGSSGLALPVAGQGGAWQRIDKSMALGAGSPKAADHFGYVLAAGNFNGDSYNGRPCIDLAVASEPRGGLTFGKGGKITKVLNVGAVTIVRGGPGGLTTAGAQHLKQGSMAGGTAIKDLSEVRDQFGQGLAITAADTDGFDDLVVGAWGEDDAAGAAHVLRGSAQGLTGVGQALWRESDLQGTSKAGNAFGQTVGGTANGVLILSAPNETFPGPEIGKADIREAGWVALVRLSDSSPISASTVSPATQATVGGTLTEGGHFGRAVTAARPAFVPASAAQVRFDGTVISAGPAPRLLR
ncbi:MAG: VCBS repeat-containing protein [Myxococcales bacterium]|nr:VCBS repeat-containing protein [Myxococcales bacterium]